MLRDLIGDSSEQCQFESLAIEARETVPLRWFNRFAFAIVRRGALIRQRMDCQGRVSAIDAVGPGCVFPIEQRNGDDSAPAGYAVTRALICLCTEPPVSGSLLRGGETAADLHKLQTEALYRMERLADARGKPTVTSQVAALLCTLSDTLVRRDAGTGRIPAGFLQRDFAALLSLRHESVCRVMREFGKAGIIQASPDGVRILDRRALSSV